MEITIERHEDRDQKYTSDGFTVFVGDKRILTVFTESDLTTSKWVREVTKAHRKRSGDLVVGISVDDRRGPKSFILENNPCSLLQLCVGSHCLIYEISIYGDPIPRALKDFLSGPHTICVGMGIETVAKKLEKSYGLKVAKPVEARSLAEKGLGKHEMIKKCGLDQLAKMVLGNHMDVNRSSKKIRWDWDYPYGHVRISSEKVKFATIDAYLCFEIGFKYLGLSKGGESSKGGTSS